MTVRHSISRNPRVPAVRTSLLLLVGLAGFAACGGDVASSRDSESDGDASAGPGAWRPDASAPLDPSEPDGARESQSEGRPEAGPATACGLLQDRHAFDSVEQVVAALANDWAWSGCGFVLDWCPAKEEIVLFSREGAVLFARCGHFCGGHSTAVCATTAPEGQYEVEIESSIGGAWSLLLQQGALRRRYSLELWSRPEASAPVALLTSTDGGSSIGLEDAPHYVE